MAADTKPNDKPVDDKSAEKKEAAPPKPPVSPASEIKANLVLIHRGVTSLEPRFTNRVLRGLTTLRNKLTNTILRDVVSEVYAKGVYVRHADLLRLDLPCCRCIH
jgi:26S proteasome regulatory subunit N3